MTLCPDCNLDKDESEFWARQASCKPCNRAYSARRRACRPAFTLLRGARARASSRGLAFTIRESDIVIPSHCPVLGTPLAPTVGTGRGAGPGSPTLDRIDPSVGYTPANIRVISWRANRLKSDASIAELRQVLQYYEESLPSVS